MTVKMDEKFGAVVGSDLLVQFLAKGKNCQARERQVAFTLQDKSCGKQTVSFSPIVCETDSIIFLLIPRLKISSVKILMLWILCFSIFLN